MLCFFLLSSIILVSLWLSLESLNFKHPRIDLIAKDNNNGTIEIPSIRLQVRPEFNVDCPEGDDANLVLAWGKFAYLGLFDSFRDEDYFYSNVLGLSQLGIDLPPGLEINPSNGTL